MEGGSTAQSIYPAASLIVAQNKCRLFQFLELKEVLRPYSSECREGVFSEIEGMKRAGTVSPGPFVQPNMGFDPLYT